MRIIITIILFFSSGILNAQTKVLSLKCELLKDPAGIDILQPRLSWQITSSERDVQQTGYQVIVASSKEKLAKSEGDLWNSGRVNSSQSVHVIYNGKKLVSRQDCYWKVKIFTNKTEATSSEIASWSMGFLTPGDWKAKWIGLDKAFPWDSVTQFSRLSARYFRKEFNSASQIKKATVYIAGPGLYELYLNGKKIGDQVLAPAPTDYRKSVLYNTFDVTAEIKTGTNTIGTTLGNGRFFTMRQDYKPKKINTFGYPKMLLQLEIEYTDGKKQTVISDGTWKVTSDGPIRTNNEYDGEEYDATKELNGWSTAGFDAAKWLTAEFVSAPAGKLKAQLNPFMKVMRSVKPVSIKLLRPGIYILDLGQNMAGWIKMKVKGTKGETVQLRFAELLQANGELYVANLRDAKVTDKYTLKGSETETWEPSFVFHGFRYVEIRDYPGEPSIDDFEGRLVYDDLQTTGSFESSNAIMNQIHKNAWWGVASNYKGMPIDCPQRNERQPWLGDRAVGSLGESFMFGNATLYAKWLDDIEESQTAEGAIPDVAPAFWNYYSDNVTWPGTYIMVADMLYKQFGDRRSIEKHYPSMKKWMDYMRSKYMKDYIITKDKYGDWCVPPESLELIRSKDSLRNTNGELIATAYYYHLLDLIQGFATLLNNKNDAASFSELAGKIKSAFNKKFFNEQKKCYDNNTVTANLLPLYFGMTDKAIQPAVFEQVRQRIMVQDRGHISTGLIGTQFLMRGLTQFNRPDIAYTIASNSSYPSWGYMIANGATTIWELWNGNTASPQMNSGNHVMLLGDLIAWYYENVAGIKSGEAGFKKILMQPVVVKGLDYAKASYESLYGTIKSDWKRSGEIFSWDIEIPVNSSAVVYLPAVTLDKITETGQPLSKTNGLKTAILDNGYAKLELGSGKYHFESNIKDLPW